MRIEREGLVETITANCPELSTKVAAARALSAVIDAIKSNLKDGNEVNIHGFLNFTVKDVPAKSGVMHANGGKPYSNPACKRVAVSAGQGLRNLLNK
jgi:nucleoid DNA-binding protein